MRKGTILIVDNIPDTVAALETLLRLEGYEVWAAKGRTNALPIVNDKLIHLAVIDLRLERENDPEDLSGLHFAAELDEEIPKIILTAYRDSPPEAILGALSPDERGKAPAFDFVFKQRGPYELLNAVQKAFQNKVHYNADLCIILEKGLSYRTLVEMLKGYKDVSEEEKNKAEAMVEDLMRRLFNKAQAIHLSRIDPGPGGCGVVLAQPTFDGPGAEVVIKFGPRTSIDREFFNNHQYVLPYAPQRSTQIRGDPVRVQQLAALKYSFLAELPLSFKAFYKEETDPHAILRPVAHFFKEMWSKHYRQPLPDRHISLFQAYDEALCLKEQLTEFSNQENRSASADLLGSLPDSVAWVLRHADDSLIPGAQQTIIHGNLHGDNLFVDGEHALAIDFERTGPGPILRDFVSLEVDILTRLARLPEGDFRVLYELAVMLTTPTSPVPVLGGLSGVPKAILDNREAAKALMVVTGVRRLAHDVTRFCDIREYYWGLLLSALFVAVTAPESAIQCSRALFLAAVVADRLQRFAEEWPPKDWPHVAMIPLRDKEGLEVLRERLLSRLSDLKEQAMEPTRFRSEGILRLQKELNTVDLELSLHLFWQQ